MHFFFGCLIRDAECLEILGINTILLIRKNCSIFAASNQIIGLAGGKYAHRSAVFCYCIGLTSIAIPDGVDIIRERTFEDCSALTTVNIPSSVTSIGKRAFFDCSALTTIDIPNEVLSIDAEAFTYCSTLTAITIPENVTTIESSVFLGCSSLTSITIPDNVTIINAAAFSRCTALKSLIIGNSVERIMSGSFEGCTALKEITSKNITPPVIFSRLTFRDVDKNIPVYVPEDALADYQNARYWNEFNIIGANTGVENITGDNTTTVQKVLRDGQVLILHDGKTYTVTGQEIAE